MDVSGGQQVDVDHDIVKHRLSRQGEEIGEEEQVVDLGAVIDPNR